MYKLAWQDMELAVYCLTDMVYEDAKYIAEMKDEEIEMVIAGCNERFDEMMINAYVHYKDGYFERVMT